MARWATHRSDTGSKELRDHAKDIGFGVAVVGGVWDCDLYWGTRVIPVDWKSESADMTDGQKKLVLAGFPLRFISKPEQLDALKSELMRG